MCLSAKSKCYVSVTRRDRRQPARLRANCWISPAPAITAALPCIGVSLRVNKPTPCLPPYREHLRVGLDYWAYPSYPRLQIPGGSS